MGCVRPLVRGCQNTASPALKDATREGIVTVVRGDTMTLCDTPCHICRTGSDLRDCVSRKRRINKEEQQSVEGAGGLIFSLKLNQNDG